MIQFEPEKIESVLLSDGWHQLDWDVGTRKGNATIEDMALMKPAAEPNQRAEEVWPPGAQRVLVCSLREQGQTNLNRTVIPINAIIGIRVHDR